MKNDMQIVTKILRKGWDFQIAIFASYSQEDGSFYDVEIMTMAKYFGSVEVAEKILKTKEFNSLLNQAKKIEKLTRN
jgi:hypothetical protein